jgi:hypothetical protein
MPSVSFQHRVNQFHIALWEHRRHNAGLNSCVPSLHLG